MTMQAGDAVALTQLVRDSVVAALPRQALHLPLARLAPRLHRGHHLRLVREALEPVLRPTRSRLFELPNGDLVVVAPPGGRHLQAAEDALLTLLASDAPAGCREPSFAVLRLPEEAAALLAAVEGALVPPGGPETASPAPDLGQAAGTALTTIDLAALERGLGAASLASFFRRWPVCRLQPEGQGPETVWEDLRVDRTALRAALLPAGDLAGAPWLLRRLQRLLDRRLLAEIARPEEVRRLGPIGLGLSLASLTTAEFLHFDAMLGPAGRARVTIGMAPEDILADPDGFAFARDFCQARGYRLALDGVTGEALALLRPDRLGLDLVRLRWSATLPQARAALPRARDQVVLTGADCAAAIGWGWEAGIGLFQGRMLRPRG